MDWQTNQQQEHEQSQAQQAYGHYAGSTHAPRHNAHTHEYQPEQPSTTFQRQQYTPGYDFNQTSYSQQYILTPAPLFNGTYLAAMLSYAGGWFTGLLFFIFAGQNKYVRFHALQSLLFFGGINLIDIALVAAMSNWHHALFLPFLPYLSGFVLLFFLFLNFIACVGWFVAITQAARGKYYTLPIVGNIVARSLNHRVTLKP